MGYPKRLVLVRHAESLRNAKKLGVFFNNQKEKDALVDLSDENVPLTERGIQQALQTGKALQKKYGKFDVVFHSGYLRAEETARHILGSFKSNETRVKPVFCRDILLRERYGGYTRNMLANEAHTHFPWREKYWSESHPVFAVPPGGESIADVCTRAGMFLLKLRLDYPGKKVLVVTHARVINAFRIINENLTSDELVSIHDEDPAFCGVTDYKYNSSQNKLILCGYDTVYWK